MTLIELVSRIAILLVVLADAWLVWQVVGEQERRINLLRKEIDRLREDLQDNDDYCDALAVRVARMETEDA